MLQWLLEHVKAFNGGKDAKAKRCLGLGGCLYYLAVSLVFATINMVSVFYCFEYFLSNSALYILFMVWLWLFNL